MYEPITRRKRKKRKQSSLSGSSLLFYLILCIIGGVIFVYFFPELVSDTVQKTFRFFSSSPKLHSVTLKVNGTERELPSEAVLDVASGDSVSLVNVDTSVLFNRGLSAWIDPIHPDLSLDEAIKIDQMVEDSLQTTQDGKGKEYRLEFKKDGTPFGYVTFRVVLTASNWLNLAEQEKDRKKRLQYLTFASALSSGNSQAALQLASPMSNST